MKNFTPLVLLLLVTVIHSSKAQLIYVTPSGAGLHNGTSWSNAYAGTSLQQVLSTAAYGTEIWVAAGTYKPSIAGRDTSFEINSGLKIYGGFAGTETSRAARDWTTNVTILSGEIGDPATDTDNTDHVVHFYSADVTTVLDGFVIEHGHAIEDGMSAWVGYGGGILNEADSSNPTIRNCTLRNNYADRGGSAIAEVIVSGGLHSYITNCTFLNNDCPNIYSDGGGAIEMNAFGTVTAHIFSLIDSCTLSGGLNGGILCRGYGSRCSPTLTNTTIRNVRGVAFNASTQYFTHSGSIDAVMRNCHVTHNHDTFFGSAVQLNAYYGTKAHILIDGCTIDSNTSGFHATVDSTTDVSCKIINTRFTDNSDTGFANSSEIYLQTGSGLADTLEVDNCVIFNRISDYLGSLPDLVVENSGVRGHSYVHLNNNTFFKQEWPLGSYPTTQLQMLMYSATAATNSADIDVNNSIIYCNDTQYYSLYSTTGPTATMHVTSRNSILSKSGGSGSGWMAMGTDGGGNIMSYPLFRDTASKDLHLLCHSRAINRGSNSLIPSAVTTDFDGTARIKNGTVDMGAYEQDTTGCASPLATGIAASAGKLTVYPNPAANTITLRWQRPIGSTATAAMYDMTGKFLFAQPITAQETQLQVQSLPPGIYLLKTTVNGETTTDKIAICR